MSAYTGPQGKGAATTRRATNAEALAVACDANEALVDLITTIAPIPIHEVVYTRNEATGTRTIRIGFHDCAAYRQASKALGARKPEMRRPHSGQASYTSEIDGWAGSRDSWVLLTHICFPHLPCWEVGT